MCRFDIVHAHYVFCMLNHDGQYGDLYARLGRIARYYRPGKLHEDTLYNEEQRDIYNALADRYSAPHYDGPLDGIY